jgi:phosphoadenosine phosphosulfate reductase
MSNETAIDAIEAKAFACPCGNVAPCGQSAEEETGVSANTTPGGCDIGPTLPDPTSETRTEFGDIQAQVPETDSPDEILQRANSREWDNTFALCSGGKDSTAALHYTYHNAAFPLDGIIFIDTNIGLHETKEYVQSLGEKFDLPVYIADTRNKADRYRERIEKYGFAGPTRQSHRFEYICNKEKPLQKFLTGFEGQSLLISGATRQESDARYEAVSADGIEKDGTRTFVSPLARWTQSDVNEYLSEQGIEVSEVTELLESSGDCLCGSFADRYLELSQLREHYRYLHTYIQSLEARVIDAARNGELLKESYKEFVLWGHGSMTDPELDQAISSRKGEDMMLCRSCEPALPGISTGDMYQTLTERALRDSTVSLPDTETAFRDRFDVTQAIPDESEKHPLTAIREAYDALEEVANRLGYEDIDSLVAAKHDDTTVIRQYIDSEYPELNEQKKQQLVEKLSQKI